MKIRSWIKMGVALTGVLLVTGGCSNLGLGALGLGGGGGIMSVLSLAFQLLPLLLGTGSGISV